MRGRCTLQTSPLPRAEGASRAPRNGSDRPVLGRRARGGRLFLGVRRLRRLLRKAGFDHVEVEQDKETKTVYNKKKKKNEKKSEVVAYDFDWKVNTDADPATCTVELEHAATKSGSLTGNGWYIDEVNGTDVTDSPASPNPDAVRTYLGSHNIDC
mgnify:CR=1 FL=1